MYQIREANKMIKEFVLAIWMVTQAVKAFFLKLG